MMASMCQPGTNGVDGSTMAQACLTNSSRLREANSASSSSRKKGLVSNCAKLLEFFICQFRKIRFGRNLDRATSYTGEFVIDVILVTKQILGKEDGGGDVAGSRKAKQCAANRYSSLRLRPFHDFVELLHLAPTLDRTSADTKKRGDLFVSALHCAELLQLCEIDFHFRTRHSSPFLFEQTQFRVPVAERKTQPLQIGVAGSDLRLDGRDLAVAAGYSYCDSQSFGSDLLECPAVGLESRSLASEVLP